MRRGRTFEKYFSYDFWDLENSRRSDLMLRGCRELKAGNECLGNKLIDKALMLTRPIDLKTLEVMRRRAQKSTRTVLVELEACFNDYKVDFKYYSENPDLLKKRGYDNVDELLNENRNDL